MLAIHKPRRASPSDPQGRFLAGLVWAENIGYINLGDGTPANGANYANTTDTDFGVNIDVNTGSLTGMAWGENVGWINFSAGAQAGPLFAARISVDAPRRVHGYAWGENIGWINLDVLEEGKYVAFAGTGGCDDIDFNNNTVFPEDQDVIDFFNVLAGGECSTGNCDDIDFNNNTVFPEDQDVIDCFNVLAGGTCL